MALTRITKGVIKPNENYDTHNINSTGIVTAIGLDVNGNGDISGSLNVGGVLTYEDVTSIDSVGIITARTGLVSPYADIDDFVSVGNNIQLGNAGVITATTFKGDGDFVELDVDGHTNLDNLSVAGVSTFQDIDVDGHTNLDNVSIAGVTTIANDTEFKIGSNANNKLPFKIKQDTGAGNVNYIDSRFTYFRSHAIRMYDQDNTSHQVAYFWNNQIGLYASNVETLRVAGSGVNILNGDLTVGRDIDVDGHTNLDNVSIAGVTTTTDNIIIKADNKILKIGASEDIHIFHQGGTSIIKDINDNPINIQSDGEIKFAKDGNAETYARFIPDGAVELYWNNELKLSTNDEGIDVRDNTNTQSMVKMHTSSGFAGALYGVGNSVISLLRANLQWGIKVNSGGATELYHTGNAKKLETTSTGISLPQDLDVDGHTNLDNVSIAGVSTFSGVVRVPNGSAGAPAIHFGDSDSGVYGDSSNGVRLTAGGSDTIVATTNGVTFPPQATALTSLTLGSQSALSKPLYFADAAGVQSASILLDNSSQELRIKNGRFSGQITFTTYNTERLRIDSSGIVDIKGGVLKFAGGASTRVMYRSGDNDMIYEAAANFFYQQKIADTSHRWYTNGADTKVMIDASGRLLVGTTTEGLATYGDNFTLASSGHTGMTIRTGTGNKGTIYFSDATSGAGEYVGSLQYDHSDNSMRFRINGTDTLLINSSNNLKVPDNTQLQFGGSLTSGNGDLQIYHDSSANFNNIQSLAGSNFRIRQQGNGAALYLAATHIYLQNHNNNQTFLHAQNGGAVTLNYSGNARARTDANGFYISRVNTFSNPNNTGSETLGAMLDIGGNIHLQEVHPVGAYTDRCDLVINTNSGYGLGLSDKLRITAGGRIVVYSSVQRSYNKGWAPGNLVLHNNNNDGTVDFTQGILFTDNANNDSAGGWMHGGIVCTGSTGYNGNMCFGIDGNGASNNNVSGITERMRLDHNGTLRLSLNDLPGEESTSNIVLGRHNTASEGGQMTFCRAVDNNGLWHFDCFGNTNQPKLRFHRDGASVHEFYYNGNYYHMGSSVSDRDLKENIQTVTGTSIDKVIKLTPKTFNFIGNDTNHTGFIAQEVKEVFPSLVNGTDGNKDMGVDYHGILAHLVNCVKELKAENDLLKERVTTLEG